MTRNSDKDCHKSPERQPKESKISAGRWRRPGMQEQRQQAWRRRLKYRSRPAMWCERIAAEWLSLSPTIQVLQGLSYCPFGCFCSLSKKLKHEGRYEEALSFPLSKNSDQTSREHPRRHYGIILMRTEQGICRDLGVENKVLGLEFNATRKLECSSNGNKGFQEKTRKYKKALRTTFPHCSKSRKLAHTPFFVPMFRGHKLRQETGAEELPSRLPHSCFKETSDKELRNTSADHHAESVRCFHACGTGERST